MSLTQQHIYILNERFLNYNATCNETHHIEQHLYGRFCGQCHYSLYAQTHLELLPMLLTHNRYKAVVLCEASALDQWFQATTHTLNSKCVTAADEAFCCLLGGPHWLSQEELTKLIVGSHVRPM